MIVSAPNWNYYLFQSLRTHVKYLILAVDFILTHFHPTQALAARRLDLAQGYGQLHDNLIMIVDIGLELRKNLREVFLGVVERVEESVKWLRKSSTEIQIEYDLTFNIDI